MGWLITLGILVLLAILPLGVHVLYNEDGLLLKLILGPVRLQVLPSRGKKDKKKKEPAKKTADSKAASAKAEAPKKQTAKQTQDTPKKGGSVTDFLPLVNVALGLLDCFRRKLRVNRLDLKLIMAGGDPCNLAVNYGKAWASLGNLMPLLERFLVIQKRNIEIECDFVASTTLIIARLDLTITLGRLLAMVVVYGVRGLKEFLRIKKKRKGGAVT